MFDTCVRSICSSTDIVQCTSIIPVINHFPEINVHKEANKIKEASLFLFIIFKWLCNIWPCCKFRG